MIKGFGYKIAITVAILIIITFCIVSFERPAYDPCPSGAMMTFGGTTAPPGYLLCDGSAVSRTTYDHLFAAIGTAYGVGNGSTTFNIPDFRQRFPLGKATSGTGSTLGGTGGIIDHTHDITHTHSVDPPNTTSGAPSATISNISLLGIGSAGSGTHTHDINISAFTSGSASASTSGASNPPYLTVNYIIKF